MQRVGAYEVLYELSSGGMGSVLLGRRRGPGTFEKLVAIKTIRAELAAAPLVRAMFLDEAALLARLGHPAVAAVHDFGEEGKNLYLVMEYVAGVSLHTVSELAPPPHIVARLLAEACRGIHAAHELRDLQGALMGVVHRDISPDNLLLGFDGHVKVIDFGIALIKGRQAPVTELGTLKGKPPYMSPEQIKNEPIDRRSDVFALGAVLWELLVGEPLFSGDSIYAIARAVEHQEIQRPGALVEGLPPGLDALVMEALQRDLATRMPSAAVMAARLDEVVAAVGGETLQEWTQRTLAPQREEHRRWLAKVMGGEAAAPQRMGRATGAVTALSAVAAEDAAGEVGVAATAVAPVSRDGTGRIAEGAQRADGVDVETDVGMQGARGSGGGLAGGTSAGISGTSLARLDGEPKRAVSRIGGIDGPDGYAGDVDGDGDDGVRAPSRLRFAWIVAAGLLAAVGSWFFVLRQDEPTKLATLEPDAAMIVVKLPVPDAGVVEVVSELPVDARNEPRPRDAREAEPRRRDARTRPQPTQPTQPPQPVDEPRPSPKMPDAREPERTAAQPPGRLRAVAEPYANVVVDGQTIGPTPVLGHQLPAGKHVVSLVDPVSGEVRVRKTIDVPAGGEVRISAP